VFCAQARVCAESAFHHPVQQFNRGIQTNRIFKFSEATALHDRPEFAGRQVVASESVDMSAFVKEVHSRETWFRARSIVNHGDMCLRLANRGTSAYDVSLGATL